MVERAAPCRRQSTHGLLPHALLASRSPLAAIYRRGPSRWTALIRWDRGDDSFEVGQWHKGSVYPDRSAISPDGEHLLTFMGSFRPPYATWTALSRPPYLTALALWPKGDTWGGGAFLGDRAIALDHEPERQALAPGFVLPPGFETLAPGPATQARLARARAADPHAWQVVAGERWTTLRRAGDGPALVSTWQEADPSRPWRLERALRLRLEGRETVLHGAGWADLDRDGDLFFAIGGRLYCCAAAQVPLIASVDDAVARGRLLADFTDLAFRPLRAPYAAPDADGFAPALDRVTREDRRERRRLRGVLRTYPGTGG
jgi:hypothetical protein